jgi:hypothetical protein
MISVYNCYIISANDTNLSALASDMLLCLRRRGNKKIIPAIKDRNGTIITDATEKS